MPKTASNELFSDIEYDEIVMCAKSSVQYQLEKVVGICQKLEEILDKEAHSCYHYPTSLDFQHYIDSIIINNSILIEYYYQWVIFHIFKVKQKNKPMYKNKPIDENKQGEYFKEIFKKHGICPCKFNSDKYDAFLNFLSNGSFLILHDLNNFIKHNQATLSYSPKINLAEKFSLPYIKIRSPLNFYLAKDLPLQEIFNSPHKPKKDIKSFENMGPMFFNYENIDCVRLSSGVGVGVESILKTIKNIAKNIISKFLDEYKNRYPTECNLKELEQNLSKREPKTFQLISTYLTSQGCHLASCR